MEKKNRRRMGDRKDGRRLRTLDPYNAMTPYIMKTRTDSSNYFTDSLDVAEAEKFLREKRHNGYPGMGMLHLFIAMYIRVVAQYPAVNRFVSGQRIYARNNIEFVMTIKKELKTDSAETSVKASFDPCDTIFDVYDKLNKEIEKVRLEGEATSTDDIAKILMKFPRPLLKFAIYFLGFMDYFGLLPQSLIDASPFHGSIIITDLGSIGMPAIYHHLYNFGNLPVFMSLGAKRKALEPSAEGTLVEHKYIDYSIVADERICDGFYFSQVFRTMKRILSNPQILGAPPETVVKDID